MMYAEGVCMMLNILIRLVIVVPLSEKLSSLDSETQESKQY